jgi:hypothetical protein
MGITKWLAQTVADYSTGSQSLGVKLRLRRIENLIHLIQSVSAGGQPISILDIGGTRAYWNMLPAKLFNDHDIHVTIANLPGVNASRADFEPRFSYADVDACDLRNYSDLSFDIAHSNSVIEHVGNWQRMKAFAAEAQRIARFHFIQTPNFWFPIEPHCMTPVFHWLPLPTRHYLVQHFALGNWPRASSIDEAVRLVDSATLLSRPMLTSLFPDSRVISERFVFMCKSFTVVGRAPVTRPQKCVGSGS